MESFWGIEDLLEAYAEDNEAEREARLLELIDEDMTAFLEDAQRTIEIVRD